MKKSYTITLLSIILLLSNQSRAGKADDLIFAQFHNHGELYFRFEKPSPERLSQLASIISIDRLAPSSWIYAYANKNQFDKFVETDLDYEPLQHPSTLIKPKMQKQVDLKQAFDWDFYPTYEAYVDLMYQFEANYPELCKIVNIGQTTEGRHLLFAVISDHVNEVEEGEPQVMYTSTMHGDETTGYMLSLQLIDYLLSNYGTEAGIYEMINNEEIWINPLANPDGTYAGGNNSVSGATRFNANLVDLNRNYPDPDDGPHPDGNAYQPETNAFMALADEQQFTLSANFHGGSEVFNYPWDTYISLHPDTDWWIYTGRQWADSAQYYGPIGYFNDLNNGITNGYAWYSVSGGRQDFMNYYHHCREVTVEMSTTKLLPASQFPTYWEANYRSLINYLKQAMYGIKGQVSDSITGVALTASVFVENHDELNSWVASNNPGGWYFRPIMEGSWDLTFFAPGYSPKTISGVEAHSQEVVQLDVQLSPTESGISESSKSNLFEIGPNPFKNTLSIIYVKDDDVDFQMEVYTASGKQIIHQSINSRLMDGSYELDLSRFSSGIFYLKIDLRGQPQIWKLIKE